MVKIFPKEINEFMTVAFAEQYYSKYRHIGNTPDEHQDWYKEMCKIAPSISFDHTYITPLNAIIGFSEAILSEYDGELQPRYKSMLMDIKNSANYLLCRVKDDLDILEDNECL